MLVSTAPLDLTKGDKVTTVHHQGSLSNQTSIPLPENPAMAPNAYPPLRTHDSDVRE